MQTGAVWRSKTGVVFALVYVAVFAAAYRGYLRNRGTWFADLGLNVLAIPYVLVGRLITLDGTFELRGSQPWSLVVASVLCTALAYLAGAGVESLWRRLFVRARRK